MMNKCVVLITGATQGVGSGFATHFGAQMDEHSTLIITSRSLERATQLAERIRAGNPRVKVVPVALDLAKPDAAAFEAIVFAVEKKAKGFTFICVCRTRSHPVRSIVR
jgi:short-subunit dehydrogenase